MLRHHELHQDFDQQRSDSEQAKRRGDVDDQRLYVEAVEGAREREQEKRALQQTDGALNTQEYRWVPSSSSRGTPPLLFRSAAWTSAG